jgi:hypothetical protein
VDELTGRLASAENHFAERLKQSERHHDFLQEQTWKVPIFHNHLALRPGPIEDEGAGHGNEPKLPN